MNKVISTESQNPNTIDIDLWDSEHIAKAINDEDKKVAYAVEKVIPQIGKAIETVAEAFCNNGRLAYFGAGTSGRIGILDASEQPPTFGVEPEMVQAFIAGGDYALRYAVENAEDNPDFALQDICKFVPTPNDVIIAISANGNPVYCIEVLKQAKKIGCSTIAISSNPEAQIAKYADIFINPIVGQEVITGSSRMKSGTAQKMILNMISTGAMIRIGKTYQNYMVDLMPTNKKLIERSIRFISEICNIPPQMAMEYFEKSQKRVKIACVMAIKQCTKEEAELLLIKNDGILRKVINGKNKK